jgi:hypothetical protein
MKRHDTITITEDYLLTLRPCEYGLHDARPFLPATLSTDPSDNLTLAMAMGVYVRFAAVGTPS